MKARLRVSYSQQKPRIVHGFRSGDKISGPGPKSFQKLGNIILGQSGMYGGVLIDYPVEPDERIGKLLSLKTEKIRPITYQIDFADPKLRWMIETKGYARSEFTIRWKLFKYRLSQDGIRTTLFLPKDHPQVDNAIRLILEMKLDRHMSAESPTLF